MMEKKHTYGRVNGGKGISGGNDMATRHGGRWLLLWFQFAF